MSSETGAGMARIVAIYRYPVKGFSAQTMARAPIEAGGTLPQDRAWAVENGPGRFDPVNPRHLPKIHFLMLMRDERLATLQSELEDDGATFVIRRHGKQLVRGNLETPTGRQLIEQFLAAYMKDSLRGAPKIVAAAGHTFSDMNAKCLHIVNLASLRDLERAVGRPLDVLRFRPNIVVDGLPAWAEMQWLGQSLRIGSAAVGVFHRTRRCDATNVDPATGARDMAIPAVLQRTWGHADFGVYAKVEQGGDIAVGDQIEPM